MSFNQSIDAVCQQKIAAAHQLLGGGHNQS